MMSRYGNKILFILISIFFLGPLSAQRWVQETRLLKPKPGEESWKGAGSGSLGSELFVYNRIDQNGNRRNLVRLDGEFEVTVLKPPPFEVGIGEYITRIDVSRDDSRIVFGSSGDTHHYPTAIFSVRPDGSQLTKLVESGDGCGKFVYPGYGTHLCSVPYGGQISPDGRKVLFFNKVREWDEEAKKNFNHYYLSMVPVTGGPIVRLEEVGPGNFAVWSEDGASIYYYYSSPRGYDPWDGVPRRYDLESGRSEFLTDTPWPALRPLVVSRADGVIFFRSKQGLARLDPETGVVEVVSEVWFDTFDLSPDGRRAVGLKDGDVTLVKLDFPSSVPLEMELGVVDELELGQIPAAREKWITTKLRQGTSASLRHLSAEARKRTGVETIRWLDNDRLWCVVQEDKLDESDPGSTPPEIRVGIIRLTN